MKLGAVELLKFKKLKRRLKLVHWQAVGLLESIWLFVQRDAPLGDIGRHSNEDIASAIEWDDDPDALIETLVDTGWFDRCEFHRLVVHDWADHAPQWLIGNLNRWGKSFAVAGVSPNEAKQPAKKIATEPAKQPTEQATQQATTPSPPLASSLTTPSLTTPTQNTHTRERDRLIFPRGPSLAFREFEKIYPRFSGEAISWENWQAEVWRLVEQRGVTDAEAEQEILRGAIRFRDSPAGKDPAPGDKDVRLMSANWLKGGHHADSDKILSQPNGRPNGTRPGTRRTSAKPIADRDAADGESLASIFARCRSETERMAAGSTGLVPEASATSELVSVS